MTSPSSPSPSRFGWGFFIGALLAIGTALAGSIAWSAGWTWLHLGEPPSVTSLRERLDAQDRRIVEAERRAAEGARSSAVDAVAELSRAETRQASALREWEEERKAERLRVEEERGQERLRAETAVNQARAEITSLIEELARCKQENEGLRDDLIAEADARRRLESDKGMLLERALAAEMRNRERDAHRASTPSAPPHTGPQMDVLSSSSPWMAELAKNLPAEMLGPQPAQGSLTPPEASGAESTVSVSEAEAEARRAAETESILMAQKQAQLETLRSDANRLLELDGYGEWQFVRIGAIEAGGMRDAALAERGPLGETRRFLVAKELRFEAFSGLRSLRLHLQGGYEQLGGAPAKNFDGEEQELTWADVRLSDWRALLEPRGLWQETGVVRTGAIDARYPAADTMTLLNEVFARAQGTRRFVLRRLDGVLEGPRLQGIELHQIEVGGGGLQVIYEAESAELWWDPVQKTAELRLEHGFQRRGTQRVPFFDQRSRVFLSFEKAEEWDPERVPYHLASTAAR